MDVVLEPAVDRALVAAVAAGPDPVVGHEVADPEGQADRHEVRDQVVHAGEIGQHVQHGHAHEQRRHVEQVERQVAPDGVAGRIAVAEHPQLGQQEVVERRHLRREHRRDQVVDPEPLDQDEQRRLVDEDPEDADERELRGMQQSPEESSNMGLAVPAALPLCGLLCLNALPSVRRVAWSRVLLSAGFRSVKSTRALRPTFVLRDDSGAHPCARRRSRSMQRPVLG